MKLFVILSQQRSGTRMLVSFLRSHPRVQCGGEAARGRDKLGDIARWYDRKIECNCDAVGFVLQYNQARPEVVEWLKERGFLFIQLIRRGIRRHSLWYRSCHEVLSEEPYRVQAIVEMASKRARSTARAIQFNAHLADEVIWYEDIVPARGNVMPRTAADRLCDLLGVSRVVLTTQQVRQHPTNLREVVVNYDELAAAVPEWLEEMPEWEEKK